tara:strand:+ start:665 stop:1597 length:933 start_codon:yes stop_codon:yes gene_type:complete
MAFLDNSGDIILDAVLTDTGRYRLAQGDGSFKIAKFAVADDEINYGSYNGVHASGSAYYDLEILQTPILEGFTDNAAMMKSKLITLTKNNILWLPVMMLNEKQTKNQVNATTNAFLVTVDSRSEIETNPPSSGAIKVPTELGVIFGFSGGNASIRIDQGLDTTEVSNLQSLSADRRESQYIIEIDNRLGSIVSLTGREIKPAFIDDDEIASYYLSQDNDAEFITNLKAGEDTNMVITGPRGTSLEFRLLASIELSTSIYLFTKLGGTASYTLATSGAGTGDFYYIDTMVRITGATTGYKLDVPVRFIKRK